ncbi:MAG: hypothetical protein VR67_01820 [Peptococcaceae bacterium BRH_c8a]|nr:MAG: hypothetical protein VR67_01820 [Peptococcaceae bacterium BRH_c8a]
MEKHTRKFNLPVVAILTGFAFMIGGLFKTFLELYLYLGTENNVFIVIWFGFLVQSAIGMAVLAFLLRRHYPFRKLWLAGTSAFALGILFPALLLKQFIYAILFFPGLLVGMFFRMLLNEQSKRESLLFMITLGFLICNIMVSTIQNDIPGAVWLLEHLGPSSVTILFHMVIDIVIGFFVALGVGLMIRRRNQESSV